MKIRNLAIRRPSWRDRFVEIAREVEGSAAPRALAAARLRLRMAIPALSAQRRSRPA